MNDNSKIAVNSIVILVRLVITSLIGIFASRLVLDALGASDYGLYNVVGSIVTFLNVINGATMSTTYRYIAFEIGKKDKGDPKKIFNTCFLIHVAYAGLIVLIGLTIGEFYIANYLNVDAGKLDDARFVFHISLLTTAISTMLVPYQGMLVAFEKFSVNALIDILTCFIRFILLLLFIYGDGDRIRTYSLINMTYNIVASLCYMFFCHKNYLNIVRFKIYTTWSLYKEMISYTFWCLFGAVAMIGKSSGTPIIVNYFFGTIVNAAFAVANQVESFILMFARSLGNAATPQITKNFSGGCTDRSVKLTCYISKYTFILMLVVAFPVILEMDFLLGIWLKKVPENATLFAQLVVLGTLISSLGEGISALVSATGNIKPYQLFFHTFNLLGLPIAFLFYYYGSKPFAILVIYCVIYGLGAILKMILLKYIYKFDIKPFFKISYIKIAVMAPPLVIYYLAYSNFTINTIWGHLGGMCVSEIVLILCVLLLGTDSRERELISQYKSIVLAKIQR